MTHHDDQIEEMDAEIDLLTERIGHAKVLLAKERERAEKAEAALAAAEKEKANLDRIAMDLQALCDKQAFALAAAEERAQSRADAIMATLKIAQASVTKERERAEKAEAALAAAGTDREAWYDIGVEKAARWIEAQYSSCVWERHLVAGIRALKRLHPESNSQHEPKHHEG